MPARVPADVKEAVLKMWQVSDSRVHRWRARRRDTAVDRAPGGHPVHALLSEEIAAILDVAERWGEVDRSHRKLAHRGSYQHLVWVSPSTFRRVLIEHGLTLPEPAPRTRTEKRPWPDWLVWEPNRIWIWDFKCRRRHLISYADPRNIPILLAMVHVSGGFEVQKVGIVA